MEYMRIHQIYQTDTYIAICTESTHLQKMPWCVQMSSRAWKYGRCTKHDWLGPGGLGLVVVGWGWCDCACYSVLLLLPCRRETLQAVAVERWLTTVWDLEYIIIL